MESKKHFMPPLLTADKKTLVFFDNRFHVGQRVVATVREDERGKLRHHIRGYATISQFFSLKNKEDKTMWHAVVDLECTGKSYTVLMNDIRNEQFAYDNKPTFLAAVFTCRKGQVVIMDAIQDSIERPFYNTTCGYRIFKNSSSFVDDREINDEDLEKFNETGSIFDNDEILSKIEYHLSANERFYDEKKPVVEVYDWTFNRPISLIGYYFKESSKVISVDEYLNLTNKFKSKTKKAA